MPDAYAIALCLIVIIAVLAVAVQMLRERFVLSASAKTEHVRKLNSGVDQSKLRIRGEVLKEDLSSLKQFREFKPEVALYARKGEWEHLVERVEENRRLQKGYDEGMAALSGIEHVPEKRPFYLSHDGFISVESRLVRKMTLSYDTDCRLTVKWGYVSPKGRNAYADKASFGYAALKDLRSKCLDREAARMRAQYERGVMTASMRYDVLRRDSHRCVKCGASGKDGAKLHVDHIVPVSKGGRTEMSNLQTLCERCNLGKSNRYSD